MRTALYMNLSVIFEMLRRQIYVLDHIIYYFTGPIRPSRNAEMYSMQ